MYQIVDLRALDPKKKVHSNFKKAKKNLQKTNYRLTGRVKVYINSQQKVFEVEHHCGTVIYLTLSETETRNDKTCLTCASLDPSRTYKDYALEAQKLKEKYPNLTGQFRRKPKGRWMVTSYESKCEKGHSRWLRKDEMDTKEKCNICKIHSTESLKRLQKAVDQYTRYATKSKGTRQNPDIPRGVTERKGVIEMCVQYKGKRVRRTGYKTYKEAHEDYLYQRQKLQEAWDEDPWIF